MNIGMSRAEFEALPFRDELVNDPIDGAYFRDHDQPGRVFKALVSVTTSRLWIWECLKVDLG